ncbi:hypothetical protein H5410_012772 [Solanum commersonii]|uniref:Uncharacterized protein n=1 Tax=Solanum commersonii TaxID=4109 RepID=A0A9J6ATK9_SOLCO|nr:hypothetical protein H5410_012772 [Solanum commersonii]
MPILTWPISTLLKPTTTNLSHLIGIYVHFLSILLESSQSHFPRLILYGIHSYLIPNIVIPNLISHDMPTHPSRHSHVFHSSS